MPLNRVAGEPGDLGNDFRIRPASAWTDTSLFDVACSAAAEAFNASGALSPIRFSADDVMVQEYPTQDKLEFLFVRRIAGQEHFYRYVFDLPPAMVSDLVNSGRWKRKTLNS